MKTNFLVLICSAILFSGCYSYYQLPEPSSTSQRVDSTVAIRILLKNHTSIDLEPGKYVEVTEPANFVFGSGTIRGSREDDEDDYCGRFAGTLVDSGVTPPADFDSSKRWYEFQTPEKSLIRLNEGDFVVVDSIQGAGFWYFGSMDAIGSRIAYSGRISFDSIEKIAVEDLSVSKTSLCVMGVAAVAVPFIYYSPYILWAMLSL
jgi:hypothetical protein